MTLAKTSAAKLVIFSHIFNSAILDLASSRLSLSSGPVNIDLPRGEDIRRRLHFLILIDSLCVMTLHNLQMFCLRLIHADVRKCVSLTTNAHVFDRAPYSNFLYLIVCAICLACPHLILGQVLPLTTLPDWNTHIGSVILLGIYH